MKVLINESQCSGFKRIFDKRCQQCICVYVCIYIYMAKFVTFPIGRDNAI